jgi:hypothetical protein
MVTHYDMERGDWDICLCGDMLREALMVDGRCPECVIADNDFEAEMLVKAMVKAAVKTVVMAAECDPEGNFVIGEPSS